MLVERLLEVLVVNQRISAMSCKICTSHGGFRPENFSVRIFCCFIRRQSECLLSHVHSGSTIQRTAACVHTTMSVRL